MDFSTVAYKLKPSLDHLDLLPEYSEREYGELEDFDALIYEPTETEEISIDGLVDTYPYAGSEPVKLIGFLNRLPNQTEFLNNDLRWPIMSKRMLYVLNSVGNFQHKAIPLKIFNYSLKEEIEDYISQENLPPEICNQDYVAVQLLEHFDFIDYERSEFEEVEPNDPIPPSITYLILREPPQGFPPIFRLNRAGERVSLYVSTAAKQLLEESEIHGLRFFPVEGIKLAEVDIAR